MRQPYTFAVADDTTTTPLRASAAPPDNVQQSLRLRRFLLALPLYVVAVPLLLWTRELGLIDTGPMLVALAAAVVINVALLALIRTGINRRLRDPSLTWAQVLAGTALLFFVVYCMKGERSIALVMCPVLLLFGVFRFRTREFVVAALAMMAAYAMVIGMLHARSEIDLSIEIYRWMVLSCVLGVFAMVGGKSSELRQDLRRSNESLRSAMSTIERMATHDALTGLANRSLLNETLVHALAIAGRHRWRVALLFIDLDRFKNINDSLGHSEGDRVLQEAAERLRACAGDEHIVARLGGDEFVLVIEEVQDDDHIERVARRVNAALAAPLIANGRDLVVTASIGISVYPGDADCAQTLLSHADVAMYRVKKQGGNGACRFSAGLAASGAARLALEASLRRALDRGEFLLHYQPKVHIASGRITGVEALLRWQHPELGILPPSRFIQLAEETGLVHAIGAWVIEQACARAKSWHALGIGVPVAVNLSARQFHEPELAGFIATVLRRHGLAPDTLEIEITETMTMHDPDQARVIMRALRDVGVRLTLDDFGTGYSSLGYLKQFPVQALKLDRSFVADLPHAVSDVAITRAVIAMARTLGISVIAEGVERVEQLDCLRAEHCDEYQGFFCRRPLAADDMTEFLRHAQRKAPAVVATLPRRSAASR